MVLQLSDSTIWLIPITHCKSLLGKSLKVTVPSCVQWETADATGPSVQDSCAETEQRAGQSPANALMMQGPSHWAWDSSEAGGRKPDGPGENSIDAAKPVPPAGDATTHVGSAPWE